MQYQRTTTSTQMTGLYQVVFGSLYAKSAVALLFLAFLIQPVAPAFANGSPEAGVEPVPDVEVTQTLPETPEPAIEDTANEGSTESSADDAALSEAEEEDSEDATVLEDAAEPGQEDQSDASDIASSGSSTTTVPQSEADIDTGSVQSDPVASADTVAATSEETAPTTGAVNATTTATSSQQDVDALSDTPATTTASSTEDYATTTTSVPAPEVQDEGVDDAPDTTGSENKEVVSSATTTEEGADTSTLDEAEQEVEMSAEPVPAVHVSAENKYQFANNDCVSVGDGAYYCSDPDATNAKNEDDGLFVAPDSDGDKEVFLHIKGTTKQLSHNTLEDAAPHFDSRSQSVVWHRLIDGRYQIVSYDLASDEEQVLTQNDSNDMEPTRAGSYTVWQRWVDGNWEIMLFDGEEEMQLTHNAYHDVAPSIRGDYIVWHTSSNGARQVVVYEIETGLMSTINDEEGGMVENPRFVLMYDTTFDNGDVVTKGYDLESGELMPLAAVPAELPQELPPTDSTGETRALIQNKSTSTKNEIVTVPTGGTTGTTTSSTTTPAGMDDGGHISSTTTESAAVTATSTVELADIDMTPDDAEFELTEFDVVVTPFASSSSAHEVDTTGTTTEVQ